MSGALDNRMYWLRNLERLAGGAPSYPAEYELASESQVWGHLNYANGGILLSGLTSEADRDGLYRYLLKLRLAEGGLPVSYEKASRRGYVLREGIIGELIAILSIALESRFFLLSFGGGELTESSVKSRHECTIVHRRCSADTDPVLFAPKRRLQLGGAVAPLMDEIASIAPERHQELIFAFHHYARALREVGIDDELVFVRLVSAIEAVDGGVEIPVRRDLFACRTLDNILDCEKLTKPQRDEAQRIFDVRLSKCRFITFLSTYSKGFFKGGVWKVPHARIKRSDLDKVAGTIYDARSAYLHKGEPMFISARIRGQHTWHRDPLGEMIVGGRRFPASKKLPYPYFFHHLVRHCLLRYTRSLIAAGRG